MPECTGRPDSCKCEDCVEYRKNMAEIKDTLTELLKREGKLPYDGVGKGPKDKEDDDDSRNGH